MTQKIGGKKVQTQYIYGDVTKKQKPGLLYGLKVDGTQRVSYEYDELARLKKRTLNLDNGKKYETTYGFVPGKNAGTTTTMVSEVKNGNKRLSYTYDEMGNILEIYENGVKKCSYQYDELNRLVSEDNAWEGKTTNYTYDAGGNLTRREKTDYPPKSTGRPIIIPPQPGTEIMSQGSDNSNNAGSNAEVQVDFKPFQPINPGPTPPTDPPLVEFIEANYDNSKWKDQMTSYEDRSITYDAMGNPLSYRGMNLTWEKGHELKQAVKGGKTMTYAYATDGKRIRKTVDGAETRYYWGGGQIIGMKSGDHNIQFTYDERNQPVSMRLDDKNYYYLYNVQGDVIGMLDSAGSQVVSYQYNSWGVPLTTTDTTTERAGNWNPFRYRGYCWDEETELYYVSSRYYDPESCRWINADSELSEVGGDIRGYNLFTYCFNNPVNMDDLSGEWPKWLSGALNVVGGALQVAAGATLGATVGWTGFGAVAAGFLIVNGTATAVQGAGQIVNHITNSNVMREDNIVRTGVQKVGRAIGGDTGAKIAGGAYDVAVVAANLYAGKVGLQQAGKLPVKVNIDKVVNNPLDEFITIGPADGVIGQYCRTIPQFGYGKIYATRLGNGLYQIANGHHRVAALRALGYKTIKIYLTK